MIPPLRCEGEAFMTFWWQEEKNLLALCKWRGTCCSSLLKYEWPDLSKVILLVMFISLGCSLFIFGLFRPGDSFSPSLPSLGLLLVLYAFWVFASFSSVLWLSKSLTLPQHARPYDRYAGSKFGIHNLYKVRTRFFIWLTIPCLPHRYTGKDSLLAWNHLVDELLLQNPHFFGILLNLPNTFTTFQANFREGRLGSVYLTDQLSLHSHLFCHNSSMGSVWVFSMVFSDS